MGEQPDTRETTEPVGGVSSPSAGDAAGEASPGTPDRRSTRRGTTRVGVRPTLKARRLAPWVLGTVLAIVLVVAGAIRVREGGLTALLPVPGPAAATTATSPSGSVPPYASGTSPAKPTSSARSLRRNDCARAPGACGFPDAQSTGPRADLRLVKVPREATRGKGWHVDERGWIEIDGTGTVLEGIETDLPVNVSAPRVTVRNCRIVVAGEKWGIGLAHRSQGAILSDNEIAGRALDGPDRLMVGIKDVYGEAADLRIHRTEISRTSTGIQVEAGLVEDNYIHDLGLTGDDHTNGITSNGGSEAALVIRHNTILNQRSQTDAIGLFQDFGAQTNRTIENNLLAGGDYVLYAGANEGKESSATRIRVVGNRFSRIYFPRGGAYGPVTAYAPDSTGNEWRGNVWDEDGSPVTL